MLVLCEQVNHGDESQLADTKARRRPPERRERNLSLSYHRRVGLQTRTHEQLDEDQNGGRGRNRTGNDGRVNWNALLAAAASRPEAAWPRIVARGVR